MIAEQLPDYPDNAALDFIGVAVAGAQLVSQPGHLFQVLAARLVMVNVGQQVASVVPRGRTSLNVATGGNISEFDFLQPFCAWNGMRFRLRW